MKILLVTGRFGPLASGGIARTTYEISKRLAKTNEIMVITHKRISDESDISKIKMHTITSLNIPRTNFWVFFYMWNKNRMVKKFVKQFKPDIIYAHTPMDTFASLDHGIPIVSHVHSLYTKHFMSQESSRTFLPILYWKWFWKYRLSIENKALSKSNLVITYSDYLANLSKERGAKNIKIIPNGVDTSVFSPDGEKIPEIKKPAIMYVGRIEKIKGIQYLIETANKLPECNFYLIGEKKDDFDFPSNMYLLGKKNPSDIPIFLRSADIFINPVLRDGFEIVNIEAMASGIPVITTDAYERSTLYKNVATLVPTENTPDIISSIQEILKNDKLRNESITKGLEFSSKFNWDKIASIIDKELQNVLK